MSEELIGYHGTNKENEEYILKKGFNQSPPGKGHWLGKGIYFFDNIYYAIEWGIIKLNNKYKYEEYIKKWSILKVTLDIDNYEVLDLNDPIGYETYKRILKNIEERFPDRINDIKNDGDIEIIRLLEEIEEETGEKYISMFDILIADYSKNIYKKKKKVYSDFLPCIQKQICVKNSNAIRQKSVQDLNQEAIKEIFSIVTKNRGGIKNEEQSQITTKINGENREYSECSN